MPYSHYVFVILKKAGNLMWMEKIFGQKEIFQEGQDVKIVLFSIVGVILGIGIAFTEGWRIPIFLIFMLIMLAIIFRNPYVGVLVFILFVYFPPEEHGVGGARISLLVYLIVFIAWLIKGINEKKLNIKWSAALTTIGLLTLWLFIISLVAHVDVAKSLEGSILFSKMFLFCFLMVALCNSQKKLEIMLAVNMFGITYFALNGFHSFLFQGSVGGIFSDNNSLGHILVIFFPMTVVMIFYPNKWIKLWGWGLFPMIISTIIISNSRGSGLGMISVIIWMLFQGLKGFRWKLLGIMGLIILFVVVIMCGTKAGEKYTKRVETIETYQKDEGSAMKRIYLWQAGLKMMKDYPVTGVGMKNFVLTFPEYNPYLKPQTTHSTYIQFGSECGIPGLGLYLLLLFFHFKTLFDIKRMVDKNSFEIYYCMALEAGMIGHIIASIFIAKAYFEPVYWLIMSGAILKEIVKQRERILRESSPKVLG